MWTDQSKQRCNHYATVKSQHLSTLSAFIQFYLFCFCFFSLKVTRLQLRCSQQEAELRRREQHINRLKDRLADRFKERGSCEIHTGSSHKDVTYWRFWSDPFGNKFYSEQTIILNSTHVHTYLGPVLDDLHCDCVVLDLFLASQSRKHDGKEGKQ